MEKNEMGMPVRDRTSGGTCAEWDNATLQGLPLAYAYVPVQRWQKLYSPEDALAHGTLFEELYKPMEVYGNE